MKVWFGTTTSSFKEYKDYYYAIRKHLIDSNCILHDDWLGNYGKWIEDNPTARRNVKDIFQMCIKAINEADIVVIEFTVPNFSSSHQITYAVHKRKPTLVLRLKKDNTFADSYIEGLESPLLTIKDYSMETYGKIIDEFIGYSRIETGQGRYNVVLEKNQKYYLDWAATKYKRSRSDIIRASINALIQNDAEYTKYLGS